MSTGFRNTLAIVVFVIVLIWAMASAKAEGAESRPVPLVICDIFGNHCDEALQVSWCESRWRPNAHNGQYRGIFQMGASERRRFGHGPDAYSQARAAYRYFQLSGWRPWSCKPQ